MPRVHVCSLARIDEIAHAAGARSMVTLINVGARAGVLGAPIAASVPRLANALRDMTVRVVDGTG